MIRLLRGVADAVLPWRNPVLAHRLRWATAYRWENLLLLTLVLTTLVAQWVAFRAWWDARAYVGTMPEDFRAAAREAMWLRAVPMDNELLGDYLNLSLSVHEVLAQYVLHTWPAAFLALGLLRALVVPFWQRRRWDDPMAEELRVIPISGLQLLVGRRDWWLVKLVALMALCGLGTLLPERPLVDSIALTIAHDVDKNGGVALLVARLFLIALHVWPVVGLILLLAFYRFVQLTVVYTLAPRRNKMLRGLVIAAHLAVLAVVVAAGLAVWLPPSWQWLPVMGGVVILLGALGTLVGYCWWCTRDLITPLNED